MTASTDLPPPVPSAGPVAGVDAPLLTDAFLVGNGLSGAVAVQAEPGLWAELAGAVGDRQVVAVAVGILMGRRGYSPYWALGVLIDIATRTGRSVLDEAHRVVARHTPPDPAGSRVALDAAVVAVVSDE